MKPNHKFEPVLWGFGFDPADRPVTRIGVVLAKDSVGQQFRLRLWYRPGETVTDPFSIDRSAPPLLDRTYGIQPPVGSERVPQFHWFDLDSLGPTGSGLHVCELTCPHDRDLRPFSVGIGASEDPWDWEAGWLMLQGDEPRPAKLPHGLAWMLQGPSEDARESWSIGTSLRQMDASAAGNRPHVIEIPRQEIRGVADSIVLHGRSVELPLPTGREETVEIPAGIASVQLPYRHVELLDPPADVELRPNEALLVRSGNTDQAISMRYRGWSSRYDMLSVDPGSGNVQVSLGTQRALDPEEFPATTPRGHVPLYSVYTTFEGAEAISVAGWRDSVREGDEARYLFWLDFCRKRLPKTLRKLRSGGDIRLIGYGDSVTSLGGRDPDMLVEANGPHRDVLGYFERYGRDWKLEHCVDTRTRRHNLGWNWQLKEAIELRWPVNVQYLNWGIPGTMSGDGEIEIEGCAYPNACAPDRIARMLEDRPDLVTVAVGMNDIGEPVDTRSNVASMCETIRAAGAEVIVVAPCRPNPGWYSRDPALWLQTYEQVVGGALDADVAYVPTWEIFGDGNEGATGLSRRSHCAASMGNHPGARELSVVGRLLSAIIP
jgi:lysophospholipase L1-like esterase